MSAYFQRLISQSGLRVQTAPTAIPPQTPVSPSAPAAPESPAVADIQEMHQERIAGGRDDAQPSTEASISPSLHDCQTPLQPPARYVPAAPVSRDKKKSPADTPLRGPSTDIVIKENVIAIASNSPSAHSATHSPSTPAKSTADSSLSSRQLEQGVQEGIPAEALQEVMRWIAAAQPKPGETATEASAPSPLRQSANPAAPKSLLAPSPENIPGTPPQIPERVIEIVEEHFDSPPAFAPSAKPPTVAQVSNQSLPSSLGPEENREQSVQVSIGSIHVRVDAPVPAPSRPARPEPARVAMPNRSTSATKLRRHYVLPH